MSVLKVEWAHPRHIEDHERAPLSDGAVPVVRLDELRDWLEAHRYPRQYGATAHNGVIDDLLAELKDLA